MFTGIVEEVGRVAEIRPGARSLQLQIEARGVAGGLKVGDSIAVSGVCLTATRCAQTGFWADVMPETMNRTAFSRLRQGDPVNLERSMAADGRFGGHIVSGHVDGAGEVASLERDDNSVRMRILTPPEVLRYVIPKGSVAVDGVSLTVARLGTGWFEVSLIPHTLSVTTLGRRQPGSLVNLEADMLGKYVERLLEARLGQAGGLTPEYLREHGF